METLTIGARTLPAVAATDAKNEFGQVLEKALVTGAVAITKHNVPKAVLVSIEEYERLIGRSKLVELDAELDGLLDNMQTQESRDAVSTMLGMTPAELGRASSAEARTVKPSNAKPKTKKRG